MASYITLKKTLVRISEKCYNWQDILSNFLVISEWGQVGFLLRNNLSILKKISYKSWTNLVGVYFAVCKGAHSWPNHQTTQLGSSPAHTKPDQSLTIFSRRNEKSYPGDTDWAQNYEHSTQNELHVGQIARLSHSEFTNCFCSAFIP